MSKTKVDNKTKEERIYQVSLLLMQKPKKIILQYITENWGIKERQAYLYIKAAEKNWQEYYLNVKNWGMGYHLAKRRYLRDRLMAKGDYRGVLEVDKDEAKLVGAYPTEKMDIEHSGKIESEISEEQVDKIIDLTKKAIERLETLPKDNTGSS
jgi:hypothetical protein